MSKIHKGGETLRGLNKQLKPCGCGAPDNWCGWGYLRGGLAKAWVIVGCRGCGKEISYESKAIAVKHWNAEDYKV